MQAVKFFRDILPRSYISIGLDIGNFSIKIAQIKKKRFSQNKVLSFAVVPIGGDKSPNQVIQAVKQAYKQGGFESKKVNISIGAPDTIIRYIILPAMTKSDLLKSLDFELERYIPYKKEDMVINSRILIKISNNKMIVLLVAVESRFIQERITQIKKADYTDFSQR